MIDKLTKMAITLALMGREINELDRTEFMAFVCTMVQTWCESHDESKSELVSDVLSAIFEKESMEQA